MKMTIKLRDYQLEACESVERSFARGLHRVGISLPCRTGKTVVMAHLAAKVHAKGRRVLILVHRDILVEQTVRKLRNVLPESDVGVVKAAKNEVDRPVIVASVQTLSRQNRLAQLSLPALTMVDEAHVSAAASYLRVFDYLGTTPGGRGFMVGVSATWSRADGKGLGYFQEVVFKRSIKWAVRNGYMVEPKAVQLGGDLDFSHARINNDGDYRDSDLEEVVMIDSLRETIVDSYRRFGRGRPAVLFAPTKDSARFFGVGLTAAGFKVAEYFDSTSQTDRRFTSSAYANGAVQVLLTCTALGIGWDEPRCCIAMLARPYRHSTPFIQAVSRVLTPWPSKSVGEVWDFVGATDDKVMASVIDLSSQAEEEESDERDEYEGLEHARIDKQHTAKKIMGVREVDLFAGTDARWLTTTHGVPFVFTRDNLYWVAQDGGAWGVGRCSARSGREGQWLVQGLSSAEALEYGSEVVLAEDVSIAGKHASWRQGNRAPTPAMLDLAGSLGVVSEGLSKAKLSDAISVHRASAILANISGG